MKNTFKYLGALFFVAVLCLYSAHLNKIHQESIEKLRAYSPVPYEFAALAPELPDATGKKMDDVKIKDKIPGQPPGEYDNLKWTFSRKFSSEDINTAKIAVNFLERLTGLKYAVDYRNIYWSDDMLGSLGTNNSLLGMTVFYKTKEPWKAYIAISSSLKPPSIHDLNALRDFGSTVIHECLHASNLDIEETVRAKIERPIDMSFDLYCKVTVSEFYIFPLDKFANAPYTKMIEKVAHESGIRAPWHYSRDYNPERVRPVIQFFMMPPVNRTNN